MDDELNLDLDTEEEEKLKAKNRYEKLSEKVRLTAKEKEEAEARAVTEADKAKAMEKERDFFKDFSAQSSKYPNANEYQDKIWEKVKTGYSTEDAIVSTLAKEGKLPTQPAPVPDNVAGGSAANQLGEDGKKSVSEMTVDEKLEALKEAEKKGDLSV